MTWARLILSLIPAAVIGCAEKGGSMPTSGDRGAGRVVLPESPYYKILRDEAEMMMLRAGNVRIAIFPFDDRMFEIAKTSWSQMSSNIPKTQSGDTVVPAARFKTRTADGLKFLFLRKDTKRAFQSKYLLKVPGGNVSVDMVSADGEPFDETSLEPLLSTIQVDRSVTRPAKRGGNSPGRGAVYDLTKGPVSLRIFADNYQFMVYDEERDPFDPFPEINEMTSRRGWTSNPQSLWIYTKAHANAHRLDVRTSDRYDPDPSAARQTVHNLRLTKGVLVINDPEFVRVRVPPGDYMIYIRAYNLGAEDPDVAIELPDEDFFRHSEWERYELVLVPGVAPREGEIQDRTP
jgi:hypothetical protein